MLKNCLKVKHLAITCALVFSSLTPLVAKEKKQENPQGYTINFDNVSIKEFLKFISKIAGINVIYNENDLDFNVTIISEEETDLENIMSALVQILRIHGLTLIEEQQNLLIHKNDSVRQIPTVVSLENPLVGNKPAIMTKVFKIHRGDPSHIASLITPMLSTDALVEVSMETRQLIITDVTSSIDTIEALLLSLDAPNTPYDVDAYHSVNVPAEDLANLASKIIKPISENSTLELVAQPTTGTVYIISTPFLIERTIAVLKDLDKTPLNQMQQSRLSSENVLIHKLQFRSPLEVEQNLQLIGKEAASHGLASKEFASTLNSIKFVKTMNSLMFVGPPSDLALIHSFLQTIDVSESGFSYSSPSFYVFEPAGISLDEAKAMIADISAHLKNTPYAQPQLIATLDGAQLIGSPVNGILFTGSSEIISEIQALLSAIEHSYSTETQRIGPSNFFIYNIQRAHEEQIRLSLNHLADYLKANRYPNRELIDTIHSMRWITSTNSLIFTGPSKSLAQLKELLPTFDIPPENSKAPLSQIPPSSEFILFSPKSISIQRLKELTQEMTKNLKSSDLADPAFLKALESIKLFPSSNQAMFAGDPASLAKLQITLQELDASSSVGSRSSIEESTAFVHLEHRSAREMASLLQETATKLSIAKSASPELIATLRSAEAVNDTQTIIITGSPATIEQVKALITANDVAGPTKLSTELFVYKLKYLTVPELQEALHGIASHAHSTNPNDDTVQLSKTIETMRAIPDSGAVQFVGLPKILSKLQDILVILDSPDNMKSKSQAGLGSNFLVYNVKHAKPQVLLSDLKQLVSDSSSLLNDESLVKTVRTGRYSPDSHALIFTGTRPDLDKIQGVLQRLDVSSDGPSRTTLPGRKAEGYKTYKPKNVPGAELIQMAKNFEQHLLASGVMDKDLAETIDHLSFVNRTNMIIITGQEKEVSEVMGLLRDFDENSNKQPGSLSDNDIEQIDDTGFLIYKLQYQPGQGIVNALSVISQDLASQQLVKKNESLIQAIQSVQWVDITNSLIASGDPKVLVRLKELISSIDRPLKQVFIEVLVIETSTLDDFEFGLRWGSQGKVQDKLSWGTGNYSTNDVATPGSIQFPTAINSVNATDTFPTSKDFPPMAGGFLGALGDLIWHKGQSYATLGSLLNAIKNDLDTTVVLSQKIIAQDNQNARIFSGENIPFTGSLVTTAGLSQTTNANLEYRNIGVTLSLTPIIGDGGIVTLDIDQEISDESPGSAATSVSSQNLNGIRTTKTSMQTKVHMPDRHFLALSGTIRNSVIRSVTGIPCLGGLPLIGAAFSSTKKQTAQRNVIIFVKPHIIESPEVYVQITKNQEEIFGSREQTNVEDFYRGLEVIRSPDDVDAF